MYYYQLLNTMHSMHSSIYYAYYYYQLEYAYCTLASMHTPDNNYELVLEYAYYAYQLVAGQYYSRVSILYAKQILLLARRQYMMYRQYSSQSMYQSMYTTTPTNAVNQINQIIINHGDPVSLILAMHKTTYLSVVWQLATGLTSPLPAYDELIPQQQLERWITEQLRPAHIKPQN